LGLALLVLHWLSQKWRSSILNITSSVLLLIFTIIVAVQSCYDISFLTREIQEAKTTLISLKVDIEEKTLTISQNLALAEVTLNEKITSAETIMNQNR